MDKFNIKVIVVIIVSSFLVACSTNKTSVNPSTSAPDSNSVKSCCQHKKGKKCPASSKAVKPDCCKKAEDANLKVYNGAKSSPANTSKKAVKTCCQHKRGKKCPASKEESKPNCCKTAKELKSNNKKEVK